MGESRRNKTLIASSLFRSSITNGGVRIYLLSQIVRSALGHIQPYNHCLNGSITMCL